MRDMLSCKLLGGKPISIFPKRLHFSFLGCFNGYLGINIVTHILWMENYIDVKNINTFSTVST